MASLVVELVTPEAVLYAGEAQGLMLRSTDGEFTVLPEHATTVGDVVPSVVTVATAAGPVAFAVHGGYFEVVTAGSARDTRATILAGVAERTSDIDVPRAQAAKERLEARVAAARTDDDHAALTLAVEALARADLRLRAAHEALSAR